MLSLHCHSPLRRAATDVFSQLARRVPTEARQAKARRHFDGVEPFLVLAQRMNVAHDLGIDPMPGAAAMLLDAAKYANERRMPSRLVAIAHWLSTPQATALWKAQQVLQGMCSTCVVVNQRFSTSEAWQTMKTLAGHNQ